MLNKKINSLKNLKDASIKIVDLGLSVNSKQKSQLKSKCGTPGYISPEVLRGGSASFKSDIFSVGCIIYKLVSGQHLFFSTNQLNTLLVNAFCDIKHHLKTLITKDRLSVDFVNFMVTLLQPDPKKRASVQEALSDPIFSSKNNNINTDNKALVRECNLYLVPKIILIKADEIIPIKQINSALQQTLIKSQKEIYNCQLESEQRNFPLSSENCNLKEEVKMGGFQLSI